MRPPPSEVGFSLLEALIALAVFSMMAVALLQLAGQNANHANGLEQRLAASIVAENLAVQAMALPNPPAFGRSAGASDAGGRQLRWIQTVAPAGAAEMIRIDIQVGEGRQTLSTLTLYRDTGR